MAEVTEEPETSDGLSGWAIAFIVTIVAFYLFGLVIGYLDYRNAKDDEERKSRVWAMVIPFGPIIVSMLNRPGYADILASPVTYDSKPPPADSKPPPTYSEFIASRS
jgi:heme/copper-type cytochrome/quinol oxidase subunit 2